MDYLYALLFGLIGTAVMTIVLRLVHSSGTESTLQVHAIGSTVPRTSDSSAPGVVIHILVGLAGGVIYMLIGNEYLLYTGGLLLLGIGVGLLRGLVVSLLLTILAADQNPWERFLAAGTVPAIWHLIGNVLYGVSISVLFGITNVNWMLVY